MLDYRERKIVGKNRPKKNSGGTLFILVGAVAAGCFAAGLGTGWLLKARDDRRTAALQAQAQKAQPAASTASAPGVNPSAKGDPALTFYETLPKGERVPLGSGINPARKDAVDAPKPQPAVQQPQLPQQPQKPTVVAQEKKAPAPPPAKVAELPKSGKFAVQVASYQSKADAEAARAKLAAKGLSAHISESVVPGKGVWYRVKVGSRMEQAAAAAIAAKLDKGAIVIPDN